MSNGYLSFVMRMCQLDSSTGISTVLLFFFIAAVSACPASFQCSLNCRLGYRIDSNGCLQCECQSCPSMSQCTKNCASGFLKDLFGCDICECTDQCPTFTCSLLCPSNVGFARAPNGCPLCQCAPMKSQPIESTSSCQVTQSLLPIPRPTFISLIRRMCIVRQASDV